MPRKTARPKSKIGSPRRILAPFVVAVLVFALSGCGLLSGSGGDNAGPGNGAGHRTKLTVGTMPVLSTAAFQLALNKGYFAQAGLDIETRSLPGGAASVPMLANGELDVSFGNWPSFIKAQGQGVADLRLIADGYQASEGMMLLQTMPGRGINNVKDLKNKTVAVNTRGNIVELIMRSTLETHGLSAQDVRFRPVDFPNMPAALQNGSVDAALLTEPFVAKANRFGATTLADAATGPTADIPIAGFASTREFTEKNPEAIAKFQRVMARASTEASQDRGKVEEQLPKYAKVDPATAQLVGIGTFPSTLEPRRLQRIASLMQRFHQMPHGKMVDVNSMILPMKP